MAKLEFLQNVNRARSLFSAKVKTDHPALDPRKIESQMARAAIWLTPSAVRGFDQKDFPELTVKQRERLEQGVADFREIANQVPADKPASNQQLRKAMGALQNILVVLKPYLPESSEAKDVRKALENVKFPNDVLNREFELYTDSSGDPAVRIWFFFDDQTVGRDGFFDLTEKIRKLVQQAFAKSEIHRRPYTYFRTAAEQRAL